MLNDDLTVEQISIYSHIVCGQKKPEVVPSNHYLPSSNLQCTCESFLQKIIEWLIEEPCG